MSLQLRIATKEDPATLDECHALRYRIFSELHKFEPPNPERRERDNHDHHSIHLAVVDTSTPGDSPVRAYLRLIMPLNGANDELLPYQGAYAAKGLSLHTTFTGMARPHCELSRICKEPDAPSSDLLYLHVGALVLGEELGLSGGMAMVRRAFARSLQRHALQVRQVGDEIEYKGPRACYWLPVGQNDFRDRHPDTVQLARDEIKREIQKIQALPARPAAKVACG